VESGASSLEHGGSPPLAKERSREFDPSLENVTVLVIDDDASLIELLRSVFGRAGARVLGACGGQEGLRQFHAYHPDLVVLDIMMPDMDGWEVCRSLRRISDVPILMLTAMDAAPDITYSLDSGADDYVTKPFEIQVLLARARALLRRSRRRTEGGEPTVYEDGYLAIDLGRRRVSVRQQPVSLTSTEYALLACLFRGAGRVLSYEQILEEVWNGACLESPEYVHVYVYRLRQKLEPDPANPRYLVKEHGLGYRFEPQLPAARTS
jgi:two-component system KDP operon response regulator KdpE